MEKIEYIGKIKLDLTRYPGEDFYCDGEVEDELLNIAKNLSPVEFDRVIEEKESWPILYHLSSLRENIVEWIPMSPDAKVLEVGSGCGAITGAFARKAGSVTCVDLSKKRSSINAYRHGDCDNITIHVGNFKDIEPDLPNDFDYICLIGVFEYGQGYIGGETPYEDFLKILMPHLKKGGRIIIAIENKYGLKYFAGCKEDHLGTYFSGIENYVEGGGVRTFSRNRLETIFKNCGVEEYHFYYPYPDYKFMTTLYSDEYQPRKGELFNNMRNYDRDRMLLFDEKNAYDGIAADGLFSVFANSYIAVLGGDFDLKYVKYSNDRAAKFAIKTEIVRENGVLCVRKRPMNEEAKKHIRGLVKIYEGLKERYAGGKLEVNTCKLVENDNDVYVEFAFVEGTPLSEYMDKCLDQEDQEKFQEYFKEYVERIGYNKDYPMADYDMIFSNILVSGDTWTLIDYEWTFEEAVDVKELAFRAIYCYLLENDRRNKMDYDSVLSELEITPENAQNYREQEVKFQKYVNGKRQSMSQLYNGWGKKLISPQKWLDECKVNELASRVQIYEDFGQGYSEAASYFVNGAFVKEDQIVFDIEVDGDMKNLRIDPAMFPCVCKVEEMTFNGEEISLDTHGVLTVNGRVMKDGGAKNHPSLVFPTEDPNINLNLTKLQRRRENVLCVKMQVVRLPLAIAQDMANSVKKVY